MAVTEIGIRAKLGVKTPDEAVPYINALIYGDPGAGKTFLLGTAQDHEETKPVLIIDVEGGVTTLRRRKDIDVMPIRKMAELERVHKELFNDIDMYYKTVCIDSITEMQKLDMHTVMEEQYNKKPDTTDKLVPSQREWGKSNERIRMIIRAFRDLPCNTLVTALKGSQQEDSGKTTFFPSLPGKLKYEVAGFFDIVGYLTTVKDGDSIIRQMQTVPTDRVNAKDRFDAFGGLIINPSIPLMYELISENTDVKGKDVAK